MMHIFVVTRPHVLCAKMSTLNKTLKKPFAKPPRAAFCAGMGGAYISLIRVPQWTEGMTAGVGWIALALVVFASWKPWRVLLGAYLFGGITQLQLNLQGAGVAIPVEYLAMSPYVITIVVLVILSADKSRAPGSLGRIFHASQ
jgi:simple sugar transport system permease protein